MHVALVVLVPACALLCNWQVHRALSGNDLSWAYVFEWPFFAGYGVYMWWRLVHDQMPPAGTPSGATVPGLAPDPEADAELEAYNRYLAELDARGRPKRW